MATNSQYTVDGTPVKLASTGNSPAEITITAGADIYIGGDSSVSASNGFLITNKEIFKMILADNQEVWGYHNGGGSATTVYVWKIIV